MEKYRLLYRASSVDDVEIICEHDDYDYLLSLLDTFSPDVDWDCERNYQGIPIQVGLWIEEVLE